MATVVTTATTTSCRRPAVPTCYPTTEAAATTTIPPSIDGGIILVKKGTVVDIGLSWSNWLAASDGHISASGWAADAVTPQTPTLGANGIDTGKGETITLIDATVATVGDTYYINNTVTIDDATQGGTNTYDIPARTMVATLHVRIVL